MDVERQFEALKSLLVSFLLAFAKPMILRLFSTAHNLRYIHFSHSETDETRFAMQRIAATFRQAALTMEPVTWKLASAKAGDISVRCAICLTPFPSKRSQFLSFGQYPVPPKGVAALLYDAVNAVFDTSTFGTVEDATDSPATRPSSRKNPDQRQASLRNKTVKGVDRWPAFYVRIESKSTPTLATQASVEFDNDRLPSVLQDIVALLKVLFSQLLELHQFRPKIRKARRLYHPSTAPEQPLRIDQPSFDGWRRIKSALPITQDDLCGGLPFADPSRQGNLALDDEIRLFLEDLDIEPDIMEDSRGRQDASEVRRSLEDTKYLDKSSSVTTVGSETVTWTNPRTGNVLHLNASNGCVTVPELKTQNPDTRINDSRPLSSASLVRRLPPRTCSSGQLAKRLQKWPSTTFTPRHELPITSLVLEDDEHDDQICTTQRTIRAADLATARILRQVDDKFILVMVPTSSSHLPSESLVLIDQHAADERIKVEDFYESLCSSHRVPLTRPIVFDISDEEAKRFDRSQPYFASWAVEYHIKCRATSAESPTQRLITITHLPSMVAERCRTEPKILIEMLRKEIWSTDNRRPSAPQPSSTSWISRISQCPTGLLEMVNSRACRSAIMFNDVLTKAQCQEILRRLSLCSLPFQCAHGRPNTTILTTVGYDHVSGWEDQETESFGKAFKRWYR